MLFIVEKWHKNNVLSCIDYNLQHFIEEETSDTTIFWKWPHVEDQGHLSLSLNLNVSCRAGRLASFGMTCHAQIGIWMLNQ